jgi:hypothetical protein
VIPSTDRYSIFLKNTEYTSFTTEPGIFLKYITIQDAEEN